MALNLMTSVFITKRQRIDTGRKREDHMKIKAEIGVAQPQAMEHGEPLRAAEARLDPP